MLTEKEVLDSLAMFKTALHKLKDTNASLQNSYNELEAKYNDLVSSSKSDVEVKDENLLELQKELESKDTYIKDLKAKTLGSIKHLVEDNIEVKDQQIKTLQDQYEIAATGLDNLSVKYDQLLKDYDNLKAMIASNSELTDEQHRLQSEVTLLKDANNIKDSEILGLQDKIATLQAELAVKKYDDSYLQERLDALRQEIEANQPMIDEQIIREPLEKKIVDLQENLRVKAEALSEKDNKINLLKSENETLTNKLAELNSQLLELQKPKVADYPVKVDNPGLQDVNKQVYYMFGHATEKIKDQLVRFITELYNGVDDTHAPYQLMSIETAALRAQISDKTRNVFIKRLYEMMTNGQHLIYDKDGHICSDFTRDFIIEYVTQLNPAAN